MSPRLSAQILVSFVLLASVQADAACISPAMSEQSIAIFSANPGAVLSTSPDTRALEVVTRNLSATNSALAWPLVGVAETAQPSQQAAIAAGLAQAAMACLSNDLAASKEIQRAVAGFPNQAFQTTFSSIAGDLDANAVMIASQAAIAASGSEIVVHPQRGAINTNLTGGGAGPTAPLAFGLIPVAGNNLSRDGSAAAISVSPVR